MEILCWQGEVLCESAVLVENAQHGAMRTMIAHLSTAGLAVSTREIDLAGHPSSDETSIRRMFDKADEFMPEHAFEAHVPTSDFGVSVANSCVHYADESFTRFRLGYGIIGPQLDGLVKVKGKHFL